MEFLAIVLVLVAISGLINTLLTADLRKRIDELKPPPPRDKVEAEARRRGQSWIDAHGKYHEC